MSTAINPMLARLVLHVAGIEPSRPMQVLSGTSQQARDAFDDASRKLFGSALAEDSTADGAVSIGSGRSAARALLGKRDQGGVCVVDGVTRLRLGRSKGTWIVLHSTANPQLALPMAATPAAWTIEHMLPCDRSRLTRRLRQRVLLGAAKRGIHRHLPVPGLVTQFAGPSPLEGFVAERLQQRQVSVALRPGRGAVNPKTTVVVFGASGERLAFAKVADVASAGAYLDVAADAMQQIALPGVPEVLFHGDYAGRRIVVESDVLEDQLPPPSASFTASHANWLLARFDTHGSWSPLQDTPFWTTLQRRVTTHAPHVASALAAAATRVGALPVALDWIHRDFDEKNARPDGRGGLRVVDWEWSRRDWPALFDLIGMHYTAPAAIAAPLEAALSALTAPSVAVRLVLDRLPLGHDQGVGLVALWLLDRIALSAELGHGAGPSVLQLENALTRCLSR